ncbi:stage III sporulation protein AF [Paenibacillus mendelii]|uniref:Stage III sporulation protein AF n=1 Tax=Paenibacillus mendelii TaxID=206163 RepID=A0ABV6JI94_9BACL|nr:stage III sporulation protein AF [Paenibacillus mendelii]MCQ6558158.1 stage III sporulation protein AF [Paenibacillus mendelii]
MLAWLATWLKQIIAVVLLAGLIDLLLPNKTMQRYVRLVAGLIILLTLLSPIIRLLQGDFDTRLNASFENWLKAPPSKEFKMPTLEDIQRDADALRRKQEAAAAALTEKQLAAAMSEALERGTGLQVMSVSVRLEGDGKTEPASLQGVEVTLDSMEDNGAEVDPGASDHSPGGTDTDSKSAGTSATPDSNKEVQPVEPVDSVSVFVQVDPDDSDDADARQTADKGYSLVDGRTAEVIRRVLNEGWSVPPDLVRVRIATGDGSSTGRAS